MDLEAVDGQCSAKRKLRDWASVFGIFNVRMDHRLHRLENPQPQIYEPRKSNVPQAPVPKPSIAPARRSVASEKHTYKFRGGFKENCG